jgi:ATP sulfurylase
VYIHGMKTFARTALIPMSAKPLHRGHDALIQLALSECEDVVVFVSLSDRGNVKGKAMETIWRDFVIPRYPNAKIVVGMKDTPVRCVYHTLGVADGEVSYSASIYVVYGDPESLSENFPEKSLFKYAGNLYREQRVLLRPVPRTETMQISGTEMRRLLAIGDKTRFMAGLPAWMDGEEVWRRLRA